MAETVPNEFFHKLKALAIADLEEEKSEFAPELWGPGDERDLQMIKEAETELEILAVLTLRIAIVNADILV